MRIATSLWSWINSVLTGTEREMLVREVCDSLSLHMEKGCGVLSRWNIQEYHGQMDNSMSSRLVAECYAQALCVEFLQEQCRLSHKSKSIAFRSICKMLLLAFSRSKVLVLNEFNSTVVLQLLRLAFIVLHEARMPSFLASLLLDRTLSASLHFFSFRPSWALDGKRDGTGNGPGVVRSRGAWIVVPSWMGRIQSVARSSEQEAVGFGMTQVHLLIQLGMSIQVLFKGGGESIFSTVKEWENSDEKEGEWLGFLDQHRDLAVSSGFGYEDSKLALEELWQMPSESNSELFSDGRNAEEVRSSLFGGKFSRQSLSNSEQASIYGRSLPAMLSADSNENDPGMILKARSRLLVMLISSQVRRISVWNNPRNVRSDSSALEKSFLKESSIRQSWALNVRTAWNFEPELAFDFFIRYQNAEVFDELKKCLIGRPITASSLQGDVSCRIAAALLSSMYVLGSKHALALMRPISIFSVMTIVRDCLIDCQNVKTDLPNGLKDSLQPHMAKYVANCILHDCIRHKANSQELFLCLPQLLQVGLYNDKSQSILSAIQRCARNCRTVRRVLAPLFRIELGISFETFCDGYKKTSRTRPINQSGPPLGPAISRSPDFLHQVEKFFDFSDVIDEESCLSEIFRTCNALNVVDHASRYKYFINAVQAIIANEGSNFMLSTPSEPIAINGIVTDTLIRDVQDELAVDQSTIVAGFLPSISTPSSPDGGHEHIRWCLIEFNTNTRQQILTHQFINAMKFLLAKGQVEIIIAARLCLPFAEDRAIIDLKVNLTERLMRLTHGTLSQRFEAFFGPPHSSPYQSARASFIQSFAGSFLLSYFLHVKDHTNMSNRLTFDEDGVHFLRDPSFPVETLPTSSDRSTFKLSSEIVSFLGGHGKGNVEPFKYFCNLTVKGFLVLREEQDCLISLVSIFLHRYPHFKRDCLDQLRDKFLPGKNEREAASYMMERIRESQEGTSVSSYEMFQAWMNETEN
uniref:PI3K/PI4K catalytic domain-containing protein n=1 Tax=Hanusia phi TaxID=3032 RepID=A0A7S0EZI4_9CRYP